MSAIWPEQKLCLTALHIVQFRDRFTTMFWGPAPTLSSFFTLHDHGVIAKFLHECFAHRSMLLESAAALVACLHLQLL